MSTEPETQGIDKKGIINQDKVRTQDTKTINSLRPDKSGLPKRGTRWARAKYPLTERA